MKWAGMMVYFSLSIFAVLYSISRRGNVKAIFLSVLGMLFLAMGIVALTAHLGLLEDRWWYYAQIVLAVPLGATLVFAANVVSRGRRKKARLAILAIGVASLALVSVISPVADIDNPVIFPNSGIRYAFTMSEIEGAGFISVYSGNITLSSDSDFLVNPSSSVFINYYEVNPDRLISLDEELMLGNYSSDGSVKIVRDVINEKPLRLNGQVYKLNYSLDQRLLSSDLSKVYSNGGMNAYV
jgi:hypothetical protein